MQIIRIVRGRLRPGTWDKFEATLKQAAEQVGDVPGLVSRSLVRNLKEPDSGYTISIWESEAALQSYETSALSKKINPMLQSYFTGDYTVEHGELRSWVNKND